MSGCKDDKLWPDLTKLTVYCMACDHLFDEADPPIEKCPHCKNTDMKKTVYVEGEQK